ncbi:hypothetical protein TIFTF001_004442 [Ficus carica]|uniref:Uncharacterized protein n=1 Tax=Ficus carica TaxID=3494 RepID=A0AA87ZJ87_FICCA|nr:hypothetical protein TIFTF001_004442 [Ficus carica]
MFGWRDRWKGGEWWRERDGRRTPIHCLVSKEEMREMRSGGRLCFYGPAILHHSINVMILRLARYHSGGWSQVTTAEEIGLSRDHCNLDDVNREVVSRGGDRVSRSIASCNGHGGSLTIPAVVSLTPSSSVTVSFPAARWFGENSPDLGIWQRSWKTSRARDGDGL